MLRAEPPHRINAGRLWQHFWEQTLQSCWFQGIEQETNHSTIREVALSIIAATLPFQAIYFLIYTFLLENNGKLSRHMEKKLKTASNILSLIHI